MDSKIDLTEHRDFGNVWELTDILDTPVSSDDVRRRWELRNYMSLSDYEILSKVEGIFGRRVHGTVAPDLFLRLQNTYRTRCAVCGSPIYPWSTNFTNITNTCKKCNYNKIEKYIPWKYESLHSIVNRQRDGRDVLRTK